MGYDNIDNMRKAFGEIEEIVRWALETQEDGREGRQEKKNKNPHWDLSSKVTLAKPLLNRTDVDGKKRAVPLEARDVPTPLRVRRLFDEYMHEMISHLWTRKTLQRLCIRLVRHTILDFSVVPRRLIPMGRSSSSVGRWIRTVRDTTEGL
jgi:hypothetical protein